MAYIGVDINYGNIAKQTGTGDGSDTTPIAALTYTAPSNESILVFLDGVCQVPGTDFTATGTTLTFTTAPANGVAILVIFLGRNVDIGTPGDNTVNLAQLASGTDGELFTWDTSGDPAKVAVGTATHVLTSNGAGAAPTFQAGGVATGFIGGLNITNNGSDGDHDIDIAVGSARDYTDAVTMTQGTAGLTKRIDATWAVGDGNGGLDSTDTVGNNTGYGVYLIRRSDSGVVDVLISSDMTAAGSALTMPTNYDQKRLIGWVLTDGSANIYAFTQSGDYFRLGDTVLQINDSTITSNTFEDLIVTCPPLCLAYLTLSAANSSSTSVFGFAQLKTKGTSDPADQEQSSSLGIGTSGTFDAVSGKTAGVLVNSASTIEYSANEDNGACTVKIEMYACVMLTRSNP
jgi:hypothetical protein